MIRSTRARDPAGAFPFRRAAALLLAISAPACSRPAPEAPPTRARSLLVVTIDTLRADYLDAARMPALEALAQQSVRFRQAVSVGPVTLPAHASLLTGLYPTRHGVRDNTIFTLGQDVPAFAPVLRQRGFATAAFVSAIVLDSRYGLNRGFDTYDNVPVEDAERDAAATMARAKAWLATAREPFFAWIHLFEPHAPYRSGTYASEVAIADRELGGLLDFLRERGLWESTLISVAGDHGESLGEHGEQTHGFFLYDATLRIPWVLHAPGRAPQAIDDQVRIVDVLPTMVDLAGQGEVLHAGGPLQGLDGVSLVPVLERNRMPRLEAYAETFLPRHQFNWSELRALRTDRTKLIEAPRSEFYELTTDPGEARNLLDQRRDEVAGARRTLGAIERAARAASRPSSADPVIAERFMSLGYIGYSPATASLGNANALPDPKDKLPVYLQIMAALELMGKDDVPAALARVDQAIALDGDVAQAHFLRGTMLGNVGRYREAAVSLERTLALNPRYVTARFKLALALIRLGNPARAERELQVVLKDEPTNVRAWHNLAAIAYTRDDLARAEELERKAVAIDPSYPEAWNTLGAIFIVTKRTPEAIDALQRTTSLAPRNGQAFANLALALDDAGRSAEAADARQRACALDKRFCS